MFFLVFFSQSSFEKSKVFWDPEHLRVMENFLTVRTENLGENPGWDTGIGSFPL